MSHLKTFIMAIMFTATCSQAQVYYCNGVPSKYPCNGLQVEVNQNGASSNSSFNCCVKELNNGMCKYHAPSPNSAQCPGGFPDEIQHASCPESSNPMPCNH